MNLDHIFKQLKQIEPDQDYSARSRNLILYGNKPAPRVTVWQLVRANIEFGASLATMAIALYIMLGGFSTLKWSAPLQVANLDPAALKAEAQAVDLQIQLTNLNYNVSGLEKSLRFAESTPSSTLPDGIAGAATTSTVSIDEALNKLAQ